MNRFAITIAVLLAGFWSSTVLAQWTTVYYPASTTACHPAAPVTAYYAPAPHAVYYAPAPVMAPAPVAVAPVYTTRYRPLLGGTITRVRYRYAPVTYAYPPATVAYYPAY